MVGHASKNDKTTDSWLATLLKGLFVCQQEKKKKKGLKRFSSFKSIELKTPPTVTNNAETRIVMQSGVKLTHSCDPEIFRENIIRSR